MSLDNILNKNLSNIRISKDLFGNEVKHLSMQERLGFLPISIWRPDWTIVKELKGLVGDNGETRVISENSKIFRKGGRYGSKKDSDVNSQSSLFNPHLAQMILSAYCPPNAKIYDAFGGGGTRGFIASAMGHNYLGVEIRQDEVDRIRSQQIKLNTFFDIVCFDSRFYTIENESFDFSYSCPPYYNLEIYSNLEGDMSSANTYSEFLDMLKDSLKVTYLGLKKGSLAIWVVGNFRDNRGNLTHFNGDTIRLATEVGFELHDELVFWGASGASYQRVGNFQANRRSVRVHEYIIIFKK